MGCCLCWEKKEDLFVGRKQRWCTDIIFLLLFIVCWGMGIGLAAVSITKDPSLIDDILYPTDSYGNNCGKPGTATADLDKVFYPQLDTDVLNQMDVFLTYRYWDFKPTKLCASSCPSGFDLGNPILYGGVDYPCGYGDPSSGESYSCSNGTVPGTYYLFVTQDVINRCFPFDDSAKAGARKICAAPACTDAALNTTLGGTVHCASIDAYPGVTTTWELCSPGTSASVCTQQRSACSLIIDEERTDLFKPDTQTEESSKYTTDLANWVKTVMGGIAGLLRTEALLAQGLCGILLPVILGFVWAIFLWFFAAPLIYGLIVLLCVVSLGATFFFMYKAGWFGDHINLSTIYNSTLTQAADDSEKQWYAVLAVIGLILTGIQVLFFWFARKALKRLVAIVEECTKVFKQLAAIVLWPVFVQLPFMLCVFFYGAFVSYFIVMVWTETSTMITFLLAHLLLILWTIQVIKATIWSSMSAAVGVWFTTINAPGSDAPACSFGCGELWSSTALILTKHLGSMMFGALIIAICQLLRYILAAIDYYTQDLQKKNTLLWLVLKCSQCAMYCLQKTVEFISYFGYIFVAVKGQSFCRACASTFVFVAKYMTQTAVNKTVQALLRLLIGWSIPVCCASLTFYILDGIPNYSQYNAIWPALIVFISSFIIADGICTVYDCCIDTIYLMSFMDMEENNPPKYMSDDLRKGFGIDVADKEASKAAGKYKPVSRRRQEAGEVASGTKTAGKVTVLKTSTAQAEGGPSSAV